MVFPLFLPKNRIGNFVVNDHSVRYVELKQANPPLAQKWRERMLPPGIINAGKIIDIESLTNILEECVDEWKIHRRSIRFIVPDSLIIIRKVSIPADVQDDEIQGYLYLELGSTIHLPFDDPVFDIYQLGNSGKSKDILLFAAPEKYVMEYEHLFSSLKLNPIAADISSLALYRLYDQLGYAAPNEILLTVQFDLTGVNLCIFENSVPQVMRHFPLEFELEKWELKRNGHEMEYNYNGEANEMALQFEDIFKEINKFMDFYRYSLSNRKNEISKFLVNGDHPMLKAVFEEMKDRFDVPVSMLTLDATAKGIAGIVPMKLFLSLGLALKEV